MNNKKRELIKSIDDLISWLNHQKNLINIDKFNREQISYVNKLIKEINGIYIAISGIMNLNLTPKERKKIRYKCIVIGNDIIQESIYICNNDYKLAYSSCIVIDVIKRCGFTTRPSNQQIINCILECQYDIDKSLDFILKKYYGRTK